MKRKSVLDQKKDNISSRLLGTNVKEINIEKFRDPNIGKPNFKLPNGRLNDQLLKTISNKFSLDVVFNLNLSDQNISNIDVLEQCPNLVMLNIKGNSIRDLYPLRNCFQMVYLNVANNQIMFLEPLKLCEKLANLHAEGNQIKAAQCLQGLHQCKNLRTIYFKSLSGMDQNEICETSSYKQDVYKAIPSLKRLDGIPKNQILDNGEGLIKEQKKIDFKLDANSPWYTAKFPSSDQNKELVLLGEESLRKTLKDSQNKISSLEAKMKALMC